MSRSRRRVISSLRSALLTSKPPRRSTCPAVPPLSAEFVDSHCITAAPSSLKVFFVRSQSRSPSISAAPLWPVENLHCCQTWRVLYCFVTRSLPACTSALRFLSHLRRLSFYTTPYWCSPLYMRTVLAIALESPPSYFRRTCLLLYATKNLFVQHRLGTSRSHCH